ncbi:membrane protein, Rhomboid family [hydrothermal vent metagenome]|uniref:Membrane protein, Rhomboid family n=1 Tax=hydrothermal vent metagenome TaxID=652676 RepID=A0A1W1EKD2_9ZZZZ
MLSNKFQEFYRYKITYSISIIISLFYLYISLVTGNFIDITSKELATNGAIFAPMVILENEWYRVLLSMFLHGGLTHFALNTISLILVGRAFENYFSPWEYISIYFITGIAGGVISIYFHPLSVIVGASGAIFGVFGGLVGFFVAHKNALGSEFKEIMSSVGMILGFNLAIGLVFPTIDMVAHIVGVIIGFMAGYLSINSKLFWIFNVVLGISIYYFSTLVLTKELLIPLLN